MAIRSNLPEYLEGYKRFMKRIIGYVEGVNLVGFIPDSFSVN